jgi:hypothetical protein
MLHYVTKMLGILELYPFLVLFCFMLINTHIYTKKNNLKIQ